MGNYCDWGDVVARYPQASKGVDAPEMGTSFITGVEAVMDSFLVKVFTTPVTGSPPLLKTICIDLVYAKIIFNKDKASNKLREESVAMLKAIVEGDALLVDSDGEVIAALGGVVWSTTENFFDAFSMLGADQDLIDPDLREDLIDERT